MVSYNGKGRQISVFVAAGLIKAVCYKRMAATFAKGKSKQRLLRLPEACGTQAHPCGLARGVSLVVFGVVAVKGRIFWKIVV